MSYYIFADVSIDIDKDYAAEHDIHYVPMEYVLGEDTFHCEAPESDSMMHEYYEKLRNKIATHTSQITPNHYIEVFEEYVKEGKGDSIPFTFKRTKQYIRISTYGGKAA